jgi:hypothetical protein
MGKKRPERLRKKSLYEGQGLTHAYLADANMKVAFVACLLIC